MAADAGVTVTAGAKTTTTSTCAGGPAHPLLMATTLYVPAFAADTLLMVTEGWLDVKPFGPVQLYVTPGMNAEVSERVCPWQTGLLLETTGWGGSVPTARLVLEVADPQTFDTVNASVRLPALGKHTLPGEPTLELAGVPPGNVHA